MQRTVTVFRVTSAGVLPAKIGVEAPRHDDLVAAANAELAERYERVRSVSFTPAGVVAYVDGEARS